MMTSSMTRQRGVALIVVLMIVALVSIIATEMGSRLQLQVKRVSNIKDNNQAYWYAMGAEQFAMKSIKQLFKDNPDVVSLERQWNQEVSYPIPGGGIEARLQDLQACFNLNSLRELSRAEALTVDNSDDNSDSEDGRNPAPGSRADNREKRDEERDAFHRLLTVSELGIDDFTADTLRDALSDWLDSNTNMRAYGAEDSEYESLAPPYITANNLMASKSELRLLKGADPEWLGQLMKLVCVVPGEDSMRININTLVEDEAPVLAALTGMSVADARGIINSRPNDGYETVEAFLSEPEVVALELSDVRKGWFTVTTEHFILHTKTKYNNATFAMSSVLKVGGDNEISVIRREFGGSM